MPFTAGHRSETIALEPVRIVLITQRSRYRRAIAAITAVVLVLTSSQTGELPASARVVPPPPGEAVPDVDTHARGRPADQLHPWAIERAELLHIPFRALEAYAYAAKVAEVENPRCHLGWATLAAIGYVESRHGTSHGATIGPNGDVRPPIRGVALDGSDGNVRASDDETDDGFVHAMGPMQFIPSTWRLYAVDAHNDGTISADNIDDAALSAAGYLCHNGGDLATRAGWVRAIISYNDSGLYASSVRHWAAVYAAGRPL